MDDLGFQEPDDAEFRQRYDDVWATLEGPTPELAVQKIEDLLADLSVDLPVDDPRMIDLRMLLGRAWFLCDIAERALPILRAAFDDAVRVTGPATRLTFSCAGNLCRALGSLERFEEAFAVAVPAFELREATFGELDNGTLNSLGHISHLQFLSGDVEGAVETMTELVERRTEAFGPHDPRTETSKYNLTVMRARLARDQEQLGDAVVNECIEQYGETSDPHAGMRAHRAAILERTGRLHDAHREWEAAERIRFALHGEIAVTTLATAARRLWVEHRLGERGALDRLQVVRSTIERIAGPEHPTVTWIRSLGRDRDEGAMDF